LNYNNNNNNNNNNHNNCNNNYYKNTINNNNNNNNNYTCKNGYLLYRGPNGYEYCEYNGYEYCAMRCDFDAMGCDAIAIAMRYDWDTICFGTFVRSPTIL
jgi:hypothetical protein